jgi:hypothetical protein
MDAELNPAQRLHAFGQSLWLDSGHFAAWEEPELFSAEVRAAFSSLR